MFFAIPRSIVPSGGSHRNFQDPWYIPAHSRRFQKGFKRNLPEKYTEVGSSIPAGIYRTRNRDYPTDSSYRKKRNPAVSTRIITGSSSYPIGNDWKQQSNPLEIIGNHNLFHLNFNRISIWISRGFQ
jgi:hypothetical protein